MILVLGDICQDINYYGDVHKISPEAPIPIFQVKSSETKSGMAGNVIANLKAAGNEVISITKEDFYYPTTLKKRYFSKGFYLHRIDEDETSILKYVEQEIVLTRIEKIKDLKAVILQDYNKGFFTEDFVQKIINTIKNKNEEIIIVADGHKSRHAHFYRDVDYLKLNEEEYKAMGLAEITPNLGLIVTFGEKGCSLIKPNGIDREVFPSIEANTIDVTGAGDTFTSWFTSEMAKGKSEREAIKIATIAAGISVENLGCYSPSIYEVDERLAIWDCV